MSKLNKEQLFELFESGDKPTEDDFKALIEATYNEDDISERLDYVEGSITDLRNELGVNADTIKILMIGNSFSEDILSGAHNVCASAGVNAIFGNVHRSGESLSGHYTNRNTSNSHDYYKRSAINGVTNFQNVGKRSLLQAIKDEQWDIIFLQQESGSSGVYTSFNPHLGNLITFVKAEATNPKMEIGLHMTWAYPLNSTQGAFSQYDRNQVTMYNAICSAYKQAMLNNDIRLVIPTGTAIQNARNVPELQSQDNDLCSDQLHLGPLGDFIGSLTLFEAIIAKKYNKDILEHVSISMPNANYLIYMAKLCVKNAVLNPFKTTIL